MALDRLGNTIATGQVFLLAGTVRRIDGDDVLVVVGLNGEHLVRVKAGDVVKVDDATAGGGGGTVTAWKDSVRLATLANHGLSGLAAFDGVTPVAGDRVLVKAQSTASANGIYIAAAGAWSRATDADTAAKMLQATVYVQEGSSNADTIWICTTNAPITLGSTSLTFVRVGPYVAGYGLQQIGTEFSLATIEPARLFGNPFAGEDGSPIGLALTDPLYFDEGGLAVAVHPFGDAQAGVVPASGGGTSNFLRADGTWAAPAGIPVTKLLGSDHAISSTTATSVTGLAATLAAGTYHFKYVLIVQSSAIGTGLKFGVNFTGTTTRFAAALSFVSTGTTQATGTADDVAATLAGQLVEGYAAKAVSSGAGANLGPYTGVASANSDTLNFIEGIIQVSNSGDLELHHGSEGAVSTTVESGSCLILTKIA